MHCSEGEHCASELHKVAEAETEMQVRGVPATPQWGTHIHVTEPPHVCPAAVHPPPVLVVVLVVPTILIVVVVGMEVRPHSGGVGFVAARHAARPPLFVVLQECLQYLPALALGQAALHALNSVLI